MSCEPPGFCTTGALKTILFDWRSAVVVVLRQILISFSHRMCESKPFSHDQSLCHELVQAFSEALSLRGDRRHCFKNGEDRSPRETLLSPAIFFFFERDELKCSSEQVCHELGGDGYSTSMRGGSVSTVQRSQHVSFSDRTAEGFAADPIPRFLLPRVCPRHGRGESWPVWRGHPACTGLEWTGDHARPARARRQQLRGSRRDRR